MTDQHLLEQLGEPISLLEAVAPKEEVEEVAMNVYDTQQAAKESLDFLAALAMPFVYRFAFPDVFLSVWQWLLHYVFQERTFPQLALGLPRGFSKTTVMKLFVVFCTYFTVPIP